MQESGVERLVRGRLVGRESEFEEAVATWRQAAAGQGQVLLISGEPGIGKTRLVQELSTYVEVGGGIVLAGECYAEGGLPYMPVAQVIRGAFSDGFAPDLPPSVALDLIALAPDVRVCFPDLDREASAVQDLDQQRLYESVVALGDGLAQQAPLMILLDDIHWVDSGSAGLVRHLARRLRDRPVLIVATYREIELDEAWPFQGLLADLNRERLATRIKLARLSKEGTADLLETLFSEQVTPDFLDGIYRETEGNPFFIEEISRALVDSGELYYLDGRWNRPNITEMDIPQGVRVAIQSRLNRLAKDVQAVLQIAALIGREFRYDMLLATGGMGEDELITALEIAEQAQLIEELKTLDQTSLARRLSFSFTHALIHSTLLDGLSTLRRQRLQRKVALALEAGFANELDKLAPLLGRYFAEAGDIEKAQGYLLSVADRARRVFAFSEAAAAYEQALILLREEDDQELVVSVLMRLGLIYHNDYQFDKSREVYEEAFATSSLRVRSKRPRRERSCPTWRFAGMS
jgi:predicted ATPase